MKQIYPLSKMLFLLALQFILLNGSTSAQSCTPLGNQTSYGSNNTWIGYVYQGINFNAYKGYVNEGTVASPAFDRNFGGDQVAYSTNGCQIYTDTFSVRYKLSKTFSNGTYIFTVGGDDGYRLSLDGGATWLIDQWNDHGYQTTTSIGVSLNGSYNLVLEYYERFGGNRVSFSYETACTGSGNPAAYGSGDNWIGYLYQGTNFQQYKGYINRGSSNAIFDENFGSSNGNFATSDCPIITEQFSVRFRLSRHFDPGTYIITVGGDDGYRLSFDGGLTWAINRWNDQSYAITTITTTLSGTYNMVLEYYENGGDNRISFNMSGGTLPVTLSNWSVLNLGNGTARLNWTADEAVNFDYFAVQRSRNGTDFSELARIASKANTQNHAVAYEYRDNQLPEGTSYYRLAMVDHDGTIRYSAIKQLSTASLTTVSVFPTIVTANQVTLTSSTSLAGAQISILTLSGQVLQQIKGTNSNKQLLQLNHLSSGSTYLVVVQTSSGAKTVRKIIAR